MLSEENSWQPSTVHRPASGSSSKKFITQDKIQVRVGYHLLRILCVFRILGHNVQTGDCNNETTSGHQKSSSQDSSRFNSQIVPKLQHAVLQNRQSFNFKAKNKFGTQSPRHKWAARGALYRRYGTVWMMKGAKSTKFDFTQAQCKD